MHPLKDDYALMLKAIKEAGAIAKKFQDEGYKRLEDKGEGDPFLTEADIAVDTHLREKLTTARPDYGWLSEETEKDTSYLTAKRSWVVDPIDGTRDFVEGTGQFAVSIGLIENGQPIAGAVFNPMQNQLISAFKGGGVFLNGERCAPKKNVPLDKAVCLISVSEDRKNLWDAYKDKFKTRPTGSAAYKLALVGADLADMTASLKGKNFWDVCAGHIICEEAGCTFTDLSGNAVRYDTEEMRINGLMAASKEIYAALAQAVLAR